MADELKLFPPRAKAPQLSNWGVFGPDDELGTLNFLTPSAVLRGVASVKSGERYPLNLPLDEPSHRDTGIPIFKPDCPPYQRIAYRQNKRIPGGRVTSDDFIGVGCQGSSQWDALSHAGMEEPGVDGVFYNGIGLDNLDSEGRAQKLGIDKIARVGIVGRGVLVDIARMIAGGSSAPLPLDHVITPEETAACLKHEGIEVRSGDIVCVRTGWIEAYLDCPAAKRADFLKPPTPGGHPAFPGLHPDHAVMAHEQSWAAVVADNAGVEVLPHRPGTQPGHVRMLRNLGLTFGELLIFRELSEACARDKRWDFLFVAVPMMIQGGFGSPANAIAIR